MSEPQSVRGRGCSRGCLFVVLAFIALGIVVGIWIGPLVGPALRQMQHDPERQYHGNSIDNLRAMYSAMSLYHDSEGQFPNSDGWMDAIQNRIYEADLKKGEAEKKLVRPALSGQKDQYGYAMNDEASGKYKDDIKDKKTPLIFESTTTVRNAHGDPKNLRRPHGLAISVDGTILEE